MAKLASNNVVDIVFVSFVVIVFCVVPTVFSADHSSSFQRIYLPQGNGPESTAFDRAGRGPYTAISDGRILKYVGDKIGFVNFAYTVKNRPAKRFCDGTTDMNLAKVCGRGLGLGFHYRTGQLYVADASYGLLVVSPAGGLAKPLVSSAEGVPFIFLDGLEVDQDTGYVYITDLSSKYNISQIAEAIAAKDMSGRLMKYDPKTKRVTVLMRDLAAPAGVAISADGSYLVFTEYINNRVQKYWLKGPKANTGEVILNVKGNPDNIKRNYCGDFWVAETFQSPETVQLQGLRISGNGTLLETVSFSPEYNTTSLSEVFEYKKGSLILGSLYSSYLGVLYNYIA